jgi:hypothetical protein
MQTMSGSHDNKQQPLSESLDGPEELSMKTAIAEFPRLFHRAPPQIPGWVMPGWRPLLRRLLLTIDSCLTDAQAKKFTVVQVKEKFGALRFYFDAPARIRPQLNELVNKASKESETTCLRCGSPAVLVTDNDGWVSALCEQHKGPRKPVPLRDLR